MLRSTSHDAFFSAGSYSSPSMWPYVPPQGTPTAGSCGPPRFLPTLVCYGSTPGGRGLCDPRCPPVESLTYLFQVDPCCFVNSTADSAMLVQRPNLTDTRCLAPCQIICKDTRVLGGGGDEMFGNSDLKLAVFETNKNWVVIVGVLLADRDPFSLVVSLFSWPQGGTLWGSGGRKRPLCY